MIFRKIAGLLADIAPERPKDVLVTLTLRGAQSGNYSENHSKCLGVPGRIIRTDAGREGSGCIAKMFHCGITRLPGAREGDGVDEESGSSCCSLIGIIH